MTTPSIQQMLADSLLQHFPSAEVKKINKDNYVDIHLPGVHPKRGTHLGFNTAGGTIKVVFYCREEEWVQQALANGGGLLEKYSQGIRLKGNPEFSDVKTAIAAALKFIEVLGQKSVPSAGVQNSESETYTFDQAVNAYLQGDMDYVVAYVQAGNPVLQFNGDTLITNELISYVCTYMELDQRIVDLVDAGVDLDASFDDGEGYTAAHFAAWDGKDEILAYLLEAGAQADVVGEDGYTPLFLAAAGGHLNCVKLLVEKGADVNRRLKDDNVYFSKQGGTPLTVAFVNGFLGMALFLIDSGADPFVLREPCKNAPSPDLFVNFSSLVKQGAINRPLEGQLEKILSLVGKADDENSTGGDADQEAPKSSVSLDLNEFLKEIGEGDEVAHSSEDLEEEEEVNLDELIKKFVEKQGTDDIMDLLDSYLQKGKIVVVEISAFHLTKTTSSTDYFGDFVTLAGVVEKGDSLWSDLSELIGESEAEWVKEEFREENPDSIVLLYCGGKYVYAFSNPISHNENVSGEDSSEEEVTENLALYDLNEFLKEMGAGGDEERTSEDLDEEEVNLYELIDKFVDKQGADNVLDLLDKDYSQKGDIVVVEIDADDLINTLSTTDHFGDYLYISGIISFKSDTLWADLSELIGKSEINWIERLVEKENLDTLVLLYCEGNFVHAFSNKSETENVNGDDSSAEVAPENSGHLDLNKFLKEVDSGDGGEVSLKSISEEEEINLDELIKKFVEKHGKKNIMDFLGQKYSFEQDLLVVEIDADDLIKTLSTTDHFGDFVSISGIINLKEDTLWDELSELIGEPETDSWKELWDENWDSVVLFYCGGKYVCSFSNQDEEAPAEDPEVEGEESEEDGGFPMISFRTPAEGMGDAVKQYLRHWQKSSQFYAWRMGVKAYIPEFVEALFSDKVCPIFTFEEIEAIYSRITSEKIIPVLDYVPEELYNHTKRVWWLVPFCIWKEDIASLLFVDKNGFYAMFSKDGEEEINMIFNWDSVDDLDLEYEYDGDPNINRLTLIQEDGNFLTFDEFVSDPEDGSHGSYLAVIEAIWEVRRETIEASKGESMWFEGKGGEGFKEFKTPQDLLKAAKWENPNRPDASMFGG